MKIIILRRGHKTIVDDEDYEQLNQFRWNLHHGYASRWDGYEIYMHHEVIGHPVKGYVTDHINRDKLDNRRENLRHVTHAQNMQNKSHHLASSSYLGVSWCERKGKWAVQVKHNKVHHFGGYYDNEETAAKVYNTLATELFGAQATLNLEFVSVL